MKVFSYDAVVIGTGAAGYNAACRLKEFGKDVAVVTEGVQTGTSRNTGSDKQTYYKLGLAGDRADSVLEMAKNLFAGGSVDGDNALCEAALSARCFFNLLEAGVPFPVNRYGEVVGYKTDHDPYARATSAGPLTSKFMTEALQKKADSLRIPVYDGYLAVKILKDGEKAVGVLALETKTGEICAFRCGDLVIASGGPAGIFADSVYPACHTGSTGLFLEAGCAAQNLTQWQFGLASVDPRWNVSGTYMQVLPRFVSVDENGGEHEFLLEAFSDPAEALDMVFLKGYQWPFDSCKVMEGSSVIDLLVYRENVLRGRKVYLDYRKNPFGMKEIPFALLSEEAREYLEKAGACFGTPYERLEKMNAPAIELYRSKGVELSGEMLEIALCAQHHNGGVSVDLWWQTTLKGVFAVGECAGTHGVTRPGGSALNAGQAGSLRAALFIARRGHEKMEEKAFSALAERETKALKKETEFLPASPEKTLEHARRRMSDCAGAIRDRAKMKEALKEVRRERNSLSSGTVPSEKSALLSYFKLRDALTVQEAVLSAMIHFAENASGTRGSALYTDPRGEKREGLEEIFRFTPEKGETGKMIQETRLENGAFACRFRPVRPLPESDDFFENVWKGFRENQNVY